MSSTTEPRAGGASTLHSQAAAAKATTRRLAAASTREKNAALTAMADALLRATPRILEANCVDVDAAAMRGQTAALVDRLRLTEARVAQIAEGVRQIAALPDPVGRIERLEARPNGLRVGRMTVPLGLVGIVYEARPNVTIDAAALCLKSGNACLLRGGSEALASNRALVSVVGDALASAGLPREAVSFVDDTDREGVREMARLSGVLDLLIPRGGEGLIRFVTEHATVPVIQHYKGVCHVYVDGAADLAMAEAIAVNAKTHRPGVCNAMETLLVDAACAHAFLPRVADAMRAKGVALRGCGRARALVPSMAAASDADWDTEYLDLVLSVRVVDGLDAALAHIAAHGTGHTEAIVSADRDRGERFVREVDASLVLVNASTRFNDGFELGLGAEMGISTTKLHAYGPMGLEELCARKWVGYGAGQIRG
ncbi:MAG: glutamate-5-semialdehyde dehydrogenase [Sandaracinaceae bacterium]|nr:glutamate-5-semialdehyde dehydrogenase [Sandaracinaceae bacterium]